MKAIIYGDVGTNRWNEFSVYVMTSASAVQQKKEKVKRNCVACRSPHVLTAWFFSQILQLLKSFFLYDLFSFSRCANDFLTALFCSAFHEVRAESIFFSLKMRIFLVFH